MKKLFTFIVLAAVAAPVWAQTQTVRLSVPGMTCGACPITVRTALRRVSGVEKIDIDEGEKLVTVTFDDRKTTVDALTQATANAGYPSAVKP